MKTYILILTILILASFGVMSHAYAGQSCNVSPKEIKLFLDKGKKYLPECLQNKPRIKQKNNFNIRIRGSNIVYYSQPADDCYENCMSLFTKCVSNISFENGLFPNDVMYDVSWEEMRERLNRMNQIKKCTGALDRCTASCPPQSRPRPIDDDSDGDGDGDGDSGGESITSIN